MEHLALIADVKCSCKRSKCLKRYCECFQAGVWCLDTCKCQECGNGKSEGFTRDTRLKVQTAEDLRDEELEGKEIEKLRKKPKYYVKTRTKRGSYKTAYRHEVRVKNEAIRRCRAFIEKQHAELMRVKGLLQRFLDKDDSLMCLSQLTATQDSLLSDLGGEEEDEATSAPDEDLHLIISSQLSQISEIGDNCALGEILHLLDGEDASSDEKENVTREEEAEEEERGYADRLVAFLRKSKEGRDHLARFEAIDSSRASARRKRKR